MRVKQQIKSVLIAALFMGASLAWGAVGDTDRISVNSSGAEGDNSSFNTRFSISADGRYVVFESDATNLINNDTNGKRDIFVYDRQTHTTTRVSVKSDGTQSDSYSYNSAISADGRYVVFTSNATNLVDNDTNGKWDVFVHQYLPDAVNNSGASGSAGGGGCTYNPNAKGFDVMYLFMIFISLFYIFRNIKSKRENG